MSAKDSLERGLEMEFSGNSHNDNQVSKDGDQLYWQEDADHQRLKVRIICHSQ
jgi:hypothetical protein